MSQNQSYLARRAVAWLLVSVAVTAALAAPSHSGSLLVEVPVDRAAEPPTARAILLFVGDGMGDAHRTAARWKSVGQGGALAMDAAPFGGWTRTASADSSVTDSAAAATALATGVKTDNGVIGQDPAGNPLITILERAQARGLAVGLVTTTQMAHATPAAFAAHVDSRGMMAEIASQMLAAGVDVLLGGGEDEFLPDTATGCYPQPGERTDGRNLIDEAVAAGYTYVCDEAAFDAVDPVSTTHLLGLFADEGMTQPFSPSLVEMTQKAIDILSQDPDGFFLMVEGGQIDWAAHANDATLVISDTLEFDGAVAAGQAHAATAGNVLVIVTGDHETGGMSVALESSGAPDEDGPFEMPDGTEFYVNWTTGSHTAADVPTTAQGPWSGLLAGSYENTHVHDVMRAALNSWIEVEISGPSLGLIDSSQTFTATVSPVTATVPLTYTWQVTDQPPLSDTGTLSDTAVFSWTVPGTKTLVVTATNAEGSVTGTHRIALQPPEIELHSVYLPLLLRPGP